MATKSSQELGTFLHSEQHSVFAQVHLSSSIRKVLFSLPVSGGNQGPRGAGHMPRVTRPGQSSSQASCLQSMLLTVTLPEIPNAAYPKEANPPHLGEGPLGFFFGCATRLVGS